MVTKDQQKVKNYSTRDRYHIWPSLFNIAYISDKFMQTHKITSIINKVFICF